MTEEQFDGLVALEKNSIGENVPLLNTPEAAKDALDECLHPIYVLLSHSQAPNVRRSIARKLAKLANIARRIAVDLKLPKPQEDHVP